MLLHGAKQMKMHSDSLPDVKKMESKGDELWQLTSCHCWRFPFAWRRSLVGFCSWLILVAAGASCARHGGIRTRESAGHRGVGCGACLLRLVLSFKSPRHLKQACSNQGGNVLKGKTWKKAENPCFICSGGWFGWRWMDDQSAWYYNWPWTS